jgi:hypothetical protein
LHRHIKTEAAADDRAAGVAGAKSVSFAPSAAAPELPMTMAQQLAFDQCRTLSSDDAKREFLTILFSTAPYWKYEQFM